MPIFRWTKTEIQNATGIYGRNLKGYFTRGYDDPDGGAAGYAILPFTLFAPLSPLFAAGKTAFDVATREELEPVELDKLTDYTRSVLNFGFIFVRISTHERIHFINN